MSGASRPLRPGRVVACVLDETAVLVLGIGRSMTGEVTVEIDDEPGGQHTAHVTGWKLSTPTPVATHGFAALVPATGTGRPLTALRFGGPDGVRCMLAPRPVPPGEVAALVADLGGSQAGPVIDRLVDLLMDGTTNHRRLAAVAALLQAARGSDGYIELIGACHEGALLLQGWCHNLAPGRCQMALVGDGEAVRAEFGMAAFSRSDIPEGGSGMVGLIHAPKAIRPHGIEGMVFQGREGWRYVAVHPKRRISGPLETPEHIRSVLLRTQSTPDILLSLRSAANSFEGKETVSGLPVPVRMGMDSVYETDGGSLLLSGWLLDPDSHVAVVKLCRGSASVRLDERWTRLDRRDVSDSFQDQPPFARALRSADHAHGFVVQAHVPGEDADAPLYLELTLQGSRRAFLPLTTTRVPPRVAALRQIDAIDPTDWAMPAIVAAQIVPFLSTAGRAAPSVRTVLDTGSFDPESGPPIVIGFADSEADINPLLALLALDPETRKAPLVVAMPSERCQQQASRLEELAKFYRLSLRLVAARGASDLYDLLEAGMRAVRCETVVLLSGSLLPRGKGWYGRLVAAEAALKGSIVSPVLSYEDLSVRWAGSWIAPDDGDHPLTGRYAGYPLKAVTELDLTRIAAASLECCILPRRAALSAGGFSGAYLGSHDKGLDLGLRLGRSGIDCYLLPTVQMWSCDDAALSRTPAMAALVTEIDARLFKDHWSAALAADRLLQEKNA